MNFKKLALCSMVALACVAAQSAYAHTGIKVNTFTEGQGNIQTGSATAYNDFTASHGCLTNAVAEGTPAVHLDIIGQTALFPNSTNSADVKIYRFKTGSVVPNAIGVDGTVLTGTATSLPVASPSDLSDDIAGAVAGAGFSNLGLGVVSPNMFGNLVIPKVRVNSAGASVIRGYSVFNGPVAAGHGINADYLAAPITEGIVSTTGLSSFKFTVPKFNPNSCAANLIVRVAVTNYCQKGSATKTSADRKDVWIGTDTGSVKYSMTGSDHGIMPNSRSTLGMTDLNVSEQGNGKSFWPQFKVTRNLTINPLPVACNGESYDVVVQPSGTDIDSNLIIESGKFPAGAPGAKFF
ncbi:MAG: hypothetical protein WAX77_02820 [Methylococcaceae bacterium]